MRNFMKICLAIDAVGAVVWTITTVLNVAASPARYDAASFYLILAILSMACFFWGCEYLLDDEDWGSEP